MQIKIFCPFPQHYQYSCSQAKSSLAESEVLDIAFFSIFTLIPEASID
jgi:hypothetical protein